MCVFILKKSLVSRLSTVSHGRSKVHQRAFLVVERLSVVVASKTRSSEVSDGCFQGKEGRVGYNDRHRHLQYAR